MRSSQHAWKYILHVHVYNSLSNKMWRGEMRAKLSSSYPSFSRRQFTTHSRTPTGRGGGIEEKEILLLSTSTNSLVSYTRSRPSRPVAVASKPSSWSVICHLRSFRNFNPKNSQNKEKILNTNILNNNFDIFWFCVLPISASSCVCALQLVVTNVDPNFKYTR